MLKCMLCMQVICTVIDVRQNACSVVEVGVSGRQVTCKSELTEPERVVGGTRSFDSLGRRREARGYCFPDDLAGTGLPEVPGLVVSFSFFFFFQQIIIRL